MIRKIDTTNFDTLSLRQRLDRLQEQFRGELNYDILLTEDGKPFAPFVSFLLLFAPITRYIYIVDCGTFYAYSKSEIRHYCLEDVGADFDSKLSYIINGQLVISRFTKYDIAQVTTNLKDTYLLMLDPYLTYANLHLCIDWKSRVVFDVK